MKKQRKSRGLGMTFIIVCLVLSGCGAGTQEAALGSAEEYVQAAKTALAGQNSFTANFDATIAMNNAGRGSMTTKGTVTFVKEPLYMKVDTDMGVDNGSQRYILYLQKGEAEKNEDGVNQYMNYDGQWTEMTLQKTDAMNSVQIYNTAENMETLLAAAENCTMQENGGKAVISADIPAEKLYDVEAAGRFFQIAGMSSLSEVYFKGIGDVPVTFVLDKKTGAPISYEIDLAQALEKVTNNVLSELSSDNESSGITVQTYRISSELTQLGNVKAGEIPDEVKSSAINYEREISMLESDK